MPDKNEKQKHEGESDRETTGELDVAMFLAAMAADSDGPAADLDLSALKPEDKRMVLAFLQRWFGLEPPPAPPGDEEKES